MRAHAKEGFATVEDAAQAVAEYLPHRPRPKSTEGLKKNLRLSPDGRWRWHWDPRFMDGRESFDPDRDAVEKSMARRRAQHQDSGVAGARRLVRTGAGGACEGISRNSCRRPNMSMSAARGTWWRATRNDHFSVGGARLPGASSTARKPPSKPPVGKNQASERDRILPEKIILRSCGNAMPHLPPNGGLAEINFNLYVLGPNIADVCKEASWRSIRSSSANPLGKARSGLGAASARRPKRSCAREPELATFIYSTILHHDTLEDAVVHRISERLDHHDVSGEMIRQAYADALGGRAFDRRCLPRRHRRDHRPRSGHQPLHRAGALLQRLPCHRDASPGALAVRPSGARILRYYLQSRSSAVFQCDIHPECAHRARHLPRPCDRPRGRRDRGDRG